MSKNIVTEQLEKNCSFEKMMEKAYEIHDACSDRMILASDMRFNEDAGITDLSTGYEYPISDWALGQLCTKLDVPVRYISKCLDNREVALAQENMNTWLQRKKKMPLLTRFYKDGIRGVLSDRYTAYDTPRVLESLEDLLDLSEYSLKGALINSERVHLRLVSENPLHVEGEDLFPGIFVDSSDVGRASLRVTFGIYKQVCTNGLVVLRAGGLMFRQRHMGIDKELFHDGLTASLRDIDELKKASEMWVNAARHEKEKDYRAPSYREKLRRQFLLPDAASEKVINLMGERYGNTKWGLINAITEAAQGYTFEARLKLEEAAGRVLAAA